MQGTIQPQQGVVHLNTLNYRLEKEKYEHNLSNSTCLAPPTPKIDFEDIEINTTKNSKETTLT